MKSRKAGLFAAYVTLVFTIGGVPYADPSFTIALIPDTQNYHEGSSGFEADHVNSCITHTQKNTTLTCQLQWILENRAVRNIRVAIHLGDITDANGSNSSDAYKAWEATSDAYALLDRDGLTYSVVPGNHDHRRVTIEGEPVLLRDVQDFEWFFPPSRFSTTWYADSFPKVPRANRNNAVRFGAGQLKFLVISLDFAPEKDAACWADSLARALPDHHLIVATHCYQARSPLNPDSSRVPKHQPCTIDYNIVGMDGDDLWDELISLHSNIAMIVSGHVQAGASFAQRTSLASGRPVDEILVDYQDEKFAGRKHGAGWIRLIELDPALSRIRSKPINVLGITSFNARNTSDLCNTAAKKALCYQNDPNHKDHTFDTTVNFALPPDRHLEPVRFTDRFVNEDSRGNQNQSQLVMSLTGDFVGIWRDDSEAPAGAYEIFARSFNKSGCARTGGYRVNQNSHRQQREPDIGIDATDRTVTVWADDSRGASGLYQIYARGLYPDGRQRFFPFTVNQVASGDQRSPKVAVAPDGRFFVTWHDTRSDSGDIFVRGFRADASPLFNEILVNSGNTAGKQDSPDIAVSSIGDFVVAWRSGNTIRAQSFKADGSQFGALQSVATVDSATHPSVAAANDGRAAVVWAHGPHSVRARQFTIGSTLGPAGIVAEAPHGTVTYPAVDMAATGEFAVAWQDDADNNRRWQIHMRQFRANGNAIGPAQTVNHNERGQQTEPSIAIAAVKTIHGPDIRWVVSWTDDLDRNGKTQIIARGGLFPGN